MPGKIILPVNYPKHEGNIIFLAGPVMSAPRWQNESIKRIKKLDSDVNIACPSYEIEDEYIGDNFLGFDELPLNYDNCWPEVDWQMHYLEEAFTKGCLLFWLAREINHQCSYPYAQGTRSELFSKLNSEGNLVLGIEDGFSGDKYTRYYFNKKRSETPIFSTLKETCQAAVDLARKNRKHF